MGDLPVLMEYVAPFGTTIKSYWKTLGIGMLSDVIDVTVSEGLHGEYIFEMLYPDSGKLASEIQIGRVVKLRTRQDMTQVESISYKAPGSDLILDDAYYHRLGYEYQPFYINDIEYDVSGMFIVRGVHYTYKISDTYVSIHDGNGKYLPIEEMVYSNMLRPFNVLSQDWFKYKAINSTSRTWYDGMAFKDRNGTVVDGNTINGYTYIGDVALIQDIDRYREADPWSSLVPDNWFPKTYTIKHSNFHTMLLGNEQDSMRNVFNFEVIRDRHAIVMTGKRSLKSWNDAYEIRYGRDMKNIRIDIDMSDILTDIFPFFRLEDEKDFVIREYTEETHTSAGVTKTVSVTKDVIKKIKCSMEGNLFGSTKPYPFSNTGNYSLIPQAGSEKYMRKGIRFDISEYMDFESMRQEFSYGMTSNGTYSNSMLIRARTLIEKNIEEYLKRANIQFGEASAEIDFLPLWDTREAYMKPALQRLRLGDPVIIIHEPLNLKIYARVTETKYNPLTDKYDSIKIKSYSVVPN